MTIKTTLEYRVRPITRYVVTRFTSTTDEEKGVDLEGGCEERGTYDNEEIAYEVAHALCKREHESLGWPVGDERITYPTFPAEMLPPKSI